MSLHHRGDMPHETNTAADYYLFYSKGPKCDRILPWGSINFLPPVFLVIARSTIDLDLLFGKGIIRNMAF
jgi:hypothetical protein